MATFQDSITIGVPPPALRSLLSDLERHPGFVTDGFKNYRYLSRQTQGKGARAAIEVNLLGHWLPAELEVQDDSEGEITWVVTTEPAQLEARVSIVHREGRSEVRLAVTPHRRSLPAWRVRTRLKQHLRLDHDVATLFGRMLSNLKGLAEKQETRGPAPQNATPGAAEAAAARPAASPAPRTTPSPTPRPAARPAPAPAAAPSPRPAPGPAAQPASAPAAPPSSAPASSPSLVSAGLLSELGVGQAKVVRVGAQDVAVFNVDGTPFAIANTCPHRGGSLAFGVIEGSVVTCPLHGLTLDVTSGQGVSNPQARVPRFEVLVVDGELQLNPIPLTA